MAYCIPQPFSGGAVNTNPCRSKRSFLPRRACLAAGCKMLIGSKHRSCGAFSVAHSSTGGRGLLQLPTRVGGARHPAPYRANAGKRPPNLENPVSQVICQLCFFRPSALMREKRQPWPWRLRFMRTPSLVPSADEATAVHCRLGAALDVQLAPVFVEV